MSNPGWNQNGSKNSDGCDQNLPPGGRHSQQGRQHSDEPNGPSTSQPLPPLKPVPSFKGTGKNSVNQPPPGSSAKNCPTARPPANNASQSADDRQPLLPTPPETVDSGNFAKGESLAPADISTAESAAQLAAMEHAEQLVSKIVIEKPDYRKRFLVLTLLALVIFLHYAVLHWGPTFAVATLPELAKDEFSNEIGFEIEPAPEPEPEPEPVIKRIASKVKADSDSNFKVVTRREKSIAVNSASQRRVVRQPKKKVAPPTVVKKPRQQPPPPAKSVAEVFPYYKVDVAPEFIRKAAIQYPLLAKKQGLQGTVILKIFLNANGSISKVEVARSAGSLLDRSAIEMVYRSSFSPSKYKGSAVNSWFNLPVKFEL